MPRKSGTKTTAVYIVRASDAPWGDYGHILVHGMTGHLGRLDGRLQLERTGPFIPPTTHPGGRDIVLTDWAKRLLETSLAGLHFRSVSLAKIVHLDWRRWDPSAPEPAEYPQSGEPEDYILERKHDESLADEMGPVWELRPDIDPAIQDRGKFVVSAYRGQPLVRASELGGYSFVSAAMRDALERVGRPWIEFRPA
ncbi:MAG: hypothetical protein HY907_14380 [Deltaproteobacteria bacterium]|nr:hypothetical protein [Deltaproteobacteria bacterium]